jgi:non-homologous end joining protein Ku
MERFRPEVKDGKEDFIEASRKLIQRYTGFLTSEENRARFHHQLLERLSSKLEGKKVSFAELVSRLKSGTK